MDGKFSQQDKDKLIEFLNFVAKKANFNMNTQEVINYFGLLTHMQKAILPKIESNILEIVDVIEEEENVSND